MYTFTEALAVAEPELVGATAELVAEGTEANAYRILTLAPGATWHELGDVVRIGHSAVSPL